MNRKFAWNKEELNYSAILSLKLSTKKRKLDTCLSLSVPDHNFGCKTKQHRLSRKAEAEKSAMLGLR